MTTGHSRIIRNCGHQNECAILIEGDGIPRHKNKMQKKSCVVNPKLKGLSWTSKEEQDLDEKAGEMIQWEMSRSRDVRRW